MGCGIHHPRTPATTADSDNTAPLPPPRTGGDDALSSIFELESCIAAPSRSLRIGKRGSDRPHASQLERDAPQTTATNTAPHQDTLARREVDLTGGKEYWLG